MSKIIFANNPLDRMSSIRSDEEWQKTSMPWDLNELKLAKLDECENIKKIVMIILT